MTSDQVVEIDWLREPNSTILVPNSLRSFARWIASSSVARVVARRRLESLRYVDVRPGGLCSTRQTGINLHEVAIARRSG